MSFASLASGSNELVATSIAASIAELTISAIRTNAIASSSDDELDPVDADPRARATSTTTAAAKWIRMFRCVRRTWMIPSTA